LTLAAAKNLILKSFASLLAADHESLRLATSRIQLQSWLCSRIPPLTSDIVQKILFEFDKP